MMKRTVVAALCAGVAAALPTGAERAAAQAGLRDHPIAGDATQALDGEGWVATSAAGLAVGAVVPGDLITDLQAASVIGDPLYETTWKNAVWDAGNWTYTSPGFDLSAPLAAAPVKWLVFDGVKMAADISLNGVYLGVATNMFLRYTYDVSDVLKPTGNVLTVTFTTSTDVRNSEKRWNACAGGWDWAPYSTTACQGSATFSKGIWKSVYLLGASTAAITHLVPHVFYNGTYPQEPLSDGQHGGFTVNVRVYFQAPAAVAGTLTVTGDWGATASAPVSLPAGNSSAMVPIGAQDVALWWPARMGLQTLYRVTATFTPTAGAVVADSRRIGFRVFTLVTGNDTDPSTLAGRDGSGDFTMRFKINGANMWSRGANMIPMEEMEGRGSDAAHRQLVQTAVDAGMNTFRLWGGGIYEYDAWYDAADELGVLIYHDIMYAQNGHSPAVTAGQDAEIRHQVRRLSHHPSVALWDSCNECGGHGIYASFVATTVAQEDVSRPVWPSCPATGWTSGVDMLWGLPNGSPLGLQPRAAAPAGAGDADEAGARARAVAAAAAAAAARATVAAGTCQFVANVDFDNGSIGPLPSPAAASAQDCCDICTAQAGCVAATYAGGTCWMKNATQAALPQFIEGVTAVWPAASGPFPGLPNVTGCGLKGISETHGYYQHGEGFKTVNSDGSLQPFAPNVPPKLDAPYALGTACPGTYASEFGASMMSSFESMSPTLAPGHWGLHTAPMAERNYAADNDVVAYFPQIPWPAGFDNVTGALAFQRQLFLAVLGAALEVKSDISFRRTRNSFGTVVWQLNEIWPTGGWGSVEYGTVGYTPGQVLGGRWKTLQYFYQDFLYQDLFITCGVDARCFFKNDNAFKGFAGSANVSLLHVATGAVTTLAVVPLNVGPGAGASQWFCADGKGDAYGWSCNAWSALLPAAGCAASGADCVVLLNVVDRNAAPAASSFELLVAPGNMTAALPRAAPVVAFGPSNADGSVPVSVTTDGTALFVTLTTLAQGRFSDNALILPAGATASLTFLPYAGFDRGILEATTRIEHVMTYF